MRALIGNTGFVGGNLLRQRQFDALYHSRNIDEIRGRSFDEITCAAAPAEKWKANADPARDRESIGRLTSALAEARATRFILISTVDVYPIPRAVDETTVIDRSAQAPYGRHRLELEDFVRERFNAHVLRLPALFGPGLKKNAIYDLIHDHETEKIDGRGIFQFYDLTRLATDIDACVRYALPLVNFGTEPVAIADIARTCFHRELRPGTAPDSPRYDMRSIHARLWNRGDGYLYGRGEIETALSRFVEFAA